MPFCATFEGVYTPTIYLKRAYMYKQSERNEYPYAFPIVRK